MQRKAQQALPWRGFLRAQAVAMVGLLPLSVWFFGHASLPGPVPNLLGVPVSSLLVVPLSLLGLAADPFSPALADSCWAAAAAREIHFVCRDLLALAALDKDYDRAASILRRELAFADAGGQHVDAVLDWLGPGVAPARDLEFGVHFPLEVGLGF